MNNIPSLKTPKDEPIVWGSTKLQPHHLERSAFVYVRQSSAQQVRDNRESTERQYALGYRATELGWSSDQVEIVDEDQAMSGRTSDQRLGFQRLMSEVALDHVGLILGIELSRLARSNKDWHQLIELCAIFRTLLADQDGLYDPTDYNDRLLLGLKGTMSEAELHILRGRMYHALLNKAKRGDLYMLPPIGYVKTPASKFAIDPDEQVQGTIRLVFDAFDRQGTVRGVVRYLVSNQIHLPVRPHAGPNRGNLEWRSPTRDAVYTVLTHPIYKGTYRYGFRQIDPRRKKPGLPGSGRVTKKPTEYHAFLADHCPAYITADRFDRNQQTLAANRAHADSKGAPRSGISLLGGLVICAKCSRRMQVHYSGKEHLLRYSCRTNVNRGQGKGCQSFSGEELDEFVAEKVMAALEPAALQLSLAASEDLKRERECLENNWRQRLERATFDADRAHRQYQIVEPENRLVSRELERRWELALRESQEIEREYTRFRQTNSTTLSVDEQEAILALSQNLPAIWKAPSTTSEDRQRIIRILVQRVVAKVQDETDRVDVTIHWVGGFVSQYELKRPVLRYSQMADYDRLVARIDELRKQGLSFAAIAEQLHQEGFRPVKQAEKFHSDIISRIVRRLKPKPSGSKVDAARELLNKNEWLMITLATEIGIVKATLAAWVHRGWVRVARQLAGYRGRTICWADTEELDRLKRLAKTNRGWWDEPLLPELTTPKAIPQECSSTGR